MPILIDKILTALILPISITLVLSLAAITLLSVGRWQVARLIFILCLVLLWVFSTPLIAQLLLGSLERQFAPVDRNTKADVAILLGGLMINGTSDDSEPSLGRGADRALHAARLYRAGRVRYILISGGNLPWRQARVSEAEQAAYLLKEWGVPGEALLIEGQSRNTYENAQRSKSIWNAFGFHSGLLVTSASHMPRALAVFRHAGFNVEPAPADFQTEPALEGGPLALLPDAGALAASSYALREWLGLLVYRLRGWA
jgi:uncharacterized SAM-binding protein YcdF (DUF218 family)